MRELNADIAIVAMGPAGLAAAIQAAEEGLQVVAFEKASICGGATNIAVGPFGVESDIQRRNMITLSKEDCFMKFMHLVKWNADARLVRDYFWKSGDTISWLTDMGVNFFPPTQYNPESVATWHRVMPEGGGPAAARTGANMVKHMVDRALELGVEIHLETPVEKVLKEEGKVCGVIARGKDGEEIRANTRAVVIATGGFGDNPEMIKEYTGFTYGVDMYNFRVPGDRGDGLKMAWDVGAAKSDIMMERFIDCAVPHPECLAVNVMASRQPHLIVNRHGERFFNEEVISNTSHAANAVTLQPGKIAYAIYDEGIVKLFKRIGYDFPFMVRPGDHMKQYDEQFAIAQRETPQLVCKSDKLEDIAEHFGIDADNLKATVEEYNGMCETGNDTLFCKSRRYMRAVNGPYYGVQLQSNAYGSLGGIQINHKTEVVDEQSEPIRGLYAAGNDVCAIYSGTYAYEFPGNTMGFALNTGRIAAENAADYVFGLDG